MSGAAIALWVIIGLIVVAFGGCAVCMGFTKKAVKEGAQDFIEEAEKKGAERREKKANPIDVKLSKLIDAYDDDSAKAQKKYEEEYVTVDGVISELKPATATRIVLVLSPKKGDESSVECEALLRKAANVSEGDRVSVLARVAKFKTRLALEDCEVQ